MVVVRAANEGKLADTSRQTGFWERLLCHECEEKFGRYESYASRHLLNAHLPDPNPSTGLIELTSIDYRLLKLFLLSLLWRVGVAQGEFFRCVDLGPHEQRLRHMLDAENPGGPDDYGCLITPLMSEPDVPLERIVLMPMTTRLDSHNGCLLVFRGFVFQYFISKHRIADGVRRSFLNEDGEMSMLRSRGTQFPPIRELWQRCIRALRSQPSGNDV